MPQTLLSSLYSPSSSDDENEFAEILSVSQANSCLILQLLQHQQKLQPKPQDQNTDNSEPESILYEVPIGFILPQIMDFSTTDLSIWKQSLSSYQDRIQSLNKPKLVELDDFYRNKLPPLLRERNPNPHITKSELSKLMEWKLTRGKWRPRLLGFVSSLDESLVKSASQKAFESLPDVSKALSELTVLKGVGPATASAILAAYTPGVAPFMSDEAMVAALGNSKDYTLKQYIKFAEKLQAKAKELSNEGESFTPSDVEMALWSSAVGSKLLTSPPKSDSKVDLKKKSSKRKRKPSG